MNVRKRVAVTVPALACAMILATRVASAGDTLVRITIDRGRSIGATPVTLGVTHTQYTNDPWNFHDAVLRADSILRRTTTYQNQSIMGWGALNPEPYPGRYDFSSLDERLGIMRRTGGTPVITLCCAPDWMKGGRPGHTDWKRLDVAPYPQYYHAFAELARHIALRYYPFVKHYQVWNELKGLWDTKLNRWNYERYTELYNDCYEALKSVASDIQVGGPYVVMNTWLKPPSNARSKLHGPYGTVDQRSLDVVTYWLAHADGGDFIAVDGGIEAEEDGTPPDLFTATQVYEDVEGWLQERTSLPIWWSEWYSAPRVDYEHQNALDSESYIRFARGGATTPLRWQPQGIAGQPYEGDQESLWSDTRVRGGGQPFPFTTSTATFREDFPPGTPLVAATTDNAGVDVLASGSTALVVNGTGQDFNVSINGGAPRSLAPYAVLFVSY
jgi:hypothetical protein